jgi:[acyl-carrier-protein] S-malonyltransferase
MIAFVFPGQGSQHAGMGKDLVDNFKVAKEVFEEANDALGFDLASLCFNGPEEDLKLTTNTQPAILTTSIAALKVVEQETDLKPSFTAGHSLGEYSALVCAGSMQFADAVRTVRQRGAFMQEAVPVGVGAMAAIIGLDADALDSVCNDASEGEVVSAANFNSPGQVVIAGHTSAVDRAIVLAKERGAKRALPLPVSAPFHCSLMVPAGEKLADVLGDIVFNPMSIPVVSNVEALPNSDHDRIKELLIAQVSAPVKWDASIEKMVADGVERFIEIGAGKVLSGLVKRINKSASAANVEDSASLDKLLNS